jgi:hypothetical protein
MSRTAFSYEVPPPEIPRPPARNWLAKLNAKGVTVRQCPVENP